LAIHIAGRHNQEAAIKLLQARPSEIMAMESQLTMTTAVTWDLTLEELKTAYRRSISEAPGQL
jgi:hypothetical protein